MKFKVQKIIFKNHVKNIKKKKGQMTGSPHEGILMAADTTEWSSRCHREMTDFTVVSIYFGKEKENPHLTQPLISSLDSTGYQKSK